MESLLSPELVRTLEGLIQQADGQAAGTPPLLRLHLEQARHFAVLMLHAGGPDATAAERREVTRLLRIEMAGEAWSDDRVPANAIERRHKRAKDVARAVALGWLGHPAVADEVETARPGLRALAAPLGMVGQLTVTHATARLLDCGALWPDGTEWPNPFAGASRALFEEATRIQPLFVDALQQLAARIEAAGAPVDATDPSVHLVLAQLTLLDVDLSRPAALLVDDLNLWPPGSIDREAATQGHVATNASRHGRTARFQADLAAGAEFLARRLGPPPIRPPYAGGGQRATRTDTLRLRDALAGLVEQYPSLTPGSLLGIAGGDDHPALEHLRAAIEAEVGCLPDLRRLERNWPKPRQ